MGVDPLVSCIVPTANRTSAIPLLLDGLLAQTYTRLELVVVDEGADGVGNLLSVWPEAKYTRVSSTSSIGTMRNAACAAASGEIIIQFDDDDWYSPERVERQVRPIIDGRADVTGLTCAHVLEVDGARWWEPSEKLKRRMFPEGFHSGTLAFRRSYYVGGCRYPEISLGEDRAMLLSLMRRKARILALEGTDMFAYVRHGSNTWRLGGRWNSASEEWKPGRPPDGMGPLTVSRYTMALSCDARRAKSSRAVMLRQWTRILAKRIGDPLGLVEVNVSRVPVVGDDCIVIVAVESRERQLADLLALIRQWEGWSGSVLVMGIGEPEFAYRVRRRYGVETVACHSRGLAVRASRSIAFLAPFLVSSKRFVLIDVERGLPSSVASMLDGIGVDSLMSVQVRSPPLRVSLCQELADRCGVEAGDIARWYPSLPLGEVPLALDAVLLVGRERLVRMNDFVADVACRMTSILDASSVSSGIAVVATGAIWATGVVDLVDEVEISAKTRLESGSSASD